jgi:hypothetical protein
MAKKAFKRPDMAARRRYPNPGFFAASRRRPWQWKINHSGFDRAASKPCACIVAGPTRRCTASRWLICMLASDPQAFIVQRFRKIT